MIRKLIPLISLAFLLVACSGNAAQSTPSAFATAIPNRIDASTPSNNPKPATPNQLQVIIVPSELIVGQNRFAVGLIDPVKGMIHDATVHLRYFDLSNPSTPSVESEADATRLQTPDGETTIFAQEREFKRAGTWGVEVQAQFPDGTSTTRRVGFQVVSNSPTLKPGMKVPALQTRTRLSVGGDLQMLSSAPHPNPAFYQQTLAQALANGKPTVLLFSTPAFCQTRLCGPAYDTVDALQKMYGDTVNFIHVEVYSGLPNPAENNYELDPAMTAFGLQTEPWLFLIDKGVVAYRIEGLFTLDEIQQHLKPLTGL
jgi:hypothetical protein